MTVAVPEALPYTDKLAESGLYFAVSVSDPAPSDPAEIAIVADPVLSVVAAEV